MSLKDRMSSETKSLENVIRQTGGQGQPWPRGRTECPTPSESDSQKLPTVDAQRRG